MMEASLMIPFDWSLVIMTAILAVYVVTGGLKAVMYTDAFQGTIMFVMMAILLIFTYNKLGGVTEAHQALTDMAALMPEKLVKGGMLGWTQGAKFGSPLWLTIYTTVIYGVGIGVLAQPQLAVRLMTVKSDKQLNRAIAMGGVFILMMTGVAFVVGALSNAVFMQDPAFGKISIAVAEGNMDKIIPAYIEKIMPSWFSALFLLGMFAAAMSTLSSQYHAGGTSLGRDVYEKLTGEERYVSAKFSKIGVTVTIAATLIWAWVLPDSVIAYATAFFFGLCGAAFLPMFLLGLYWRGMTKAGALASMVGGFTISMFWLLFVHLKESEGLGLCNLVFGKASLFADAAVGTWWWRMQWIDPNVIALPLSFVLAIVVSKMTARMDEGHVAKCWANF